MATVYRRGNVWYGKFKHNGKRYEPCLKTDNKRLAERRLAKIVNGFHEGMGLPTKTAVGDGVADFIGHLYARHREQAVNKEIYRLREFFGPVCPELEHKHRLRRGSGKPRQPKGRLAKPYAFAVPARYLEDVTTPMVSKFIQQKITHQGIGPKTANEYREIIQRLFNWSLNERGIRMPDNRNPASPVKTYRTPAPQIRFLQPKDIWEQLRILEPFPHIQTMVSVYIFAGLRREEALWLTSRDVDLPARRLHVRAKTINEEFWQPKTARNRVIPISSVLMEHLLHYQPASTTPWFFPSPAGCRWDPCNFSSELRRINQAAGLPWSCQDYRHTFGSLAAMKGESLYKISAVMGNSPEICRRHYARLLDESLEGTVEFLTTNSTCDLHIASA